MANSSQKIAKSSQKMANPGTNMYKPDKEPTKKDHIRKTVFFEPIDRDRVKSDWSCREQIKLQRHADQGRNQAIHRWLRAAEFARTDTFDLKGGERWFRVYDVLSVVRGG